MSIWGSLIGGFVGFSFAGPIGALIGSMIGGRISSARRTGFGQSFAQTQQMFAISLIILTAKLSKADGYVSKEELAAVKVPYFRSKAGFKFAIPSAVVSPRMPLSSLIDLKLGGRDTSMISSKDPSSVAFAAS